VVEIPQRRYNAAAEHAVAMMLSLFIPDANSSVKSGKWDRKSFIGSEVYKTLGVVVG